MYNGASKTRLSTGLVVATVQTLNIENPAELRLVVGKRFQYVGLPLKICHGNGSPKRAWSGMEDHEEQPSQLLRQT